MVVVGVAGLGRGGGGLLRVWGWTSSVMGFEDDGDTYPGLGHPSRPSQIRCDIGVDVVAAIVVALPSSTSARGIGQAVGRHSHWALVEGGVGMWVLLEPGGRLVVVGVAEPFGVGGGGVRR